MGRRFIVRYNKKLSQHDDLKYFLETKLKDGTITKHYNNNQTKSQYLQQKSRTDKIVPTNS